jgi:hypothetical protein
LNSIIIYHIVMFSQGKFIFWEATKSNSIFFFFFEFMFGSINSKFNYYFSQLNSTQFILAEVVLKVNSHTKTKERKENT